MLSSIFNNKAVYDLAHKIKIRGDDVLEKYGKLSRQEAQKAISEDFAGSYCDGDQANFRIKDLEDFNFSFVFSSSEKMRFFLVQGNNEYAGFHLQASEDHQWIV